MGVGKDLSPHRQYPFLIQDIQYPPVPQPLFSQLGYFVVEKELVV